MTLKIEYVPVDELTAAEREAQSRIWRLLLTPIPKDAAQAQGDEEQAEDDVTRPE
jgi:hypothetical protein